MSLVHNGQVKLTASWFNTTASAAVVAAGYWLRGRADAAGGHHLRPGE